MADHLRTRVVVSGDIVEVFEYSNGIAVGERRQHEVKRKEVEERDGKRLDNLYRARQNIRRLVWCNITKQFTKMITLTYADTILDAKTVKLHVRRFVQQMRRFGYSMRYLYVLEHQTKRGQKEGNAGCLHVHMFLFDDEKVSLDHLNRAWKHGQTDIKVLRNIRNSGAYVCKYITKENFAEYGCHVYGCSRGLKRPTEEHLYQEGFSDTLIGGVTTRHIVDGLIVNHSSSMRHDFFDDKGVMCEQTIKYWQGKWKKENRLVTLAEEVRIDMNEDDASVNAAAILESLCR